MPGRKNHFSVFHFTPGNKRLPAIGFQMKDITADQTGSDIVGTDHNRIARNELSPTVRLKPGP